MTPSSLTPSIFSQRLSRENLLRILDIAYQAGSYRFLRQAALTWLTTYPGDLGVNLWMAKGFIAENKPAQAQPILEKLARLDPEYMEAVEVMGAPQPVSSLDAQGWARLLRRAREALQNGSPDEAEAMSKQAIESDPDAVQAAILQLHLTGARGDPAAVINLSKSYRTRWPDCLHFSLLLAEAQLETGDEVGAVTLLHRCVVNDAAGQVPARLWGENHAYRPLWPDPLEIAFDVPVPADVAARLGWNLLPAAKISHFVEELLGNKAEMPPADESAETPETNIQPPAEDEPVLPYLERLIAAEEAEGPEDAGEIEEPSTGEIPDGGKQPWQRPAEMPGEWLAIPESPEGSTLAVSNESATVSQRPAEIGPMVQPQPQPAVAASESMKSVQDEFEKIAKRLKQPGLGRADGRYPVYVIFSTESGLTRQHGAATLGVLTKEMVRLSAEIRKRPGWDAVLFYPDNEACMARYGLKPVDASDPWKLKLAIADLDTALRKKGEMIGALLIVGGPDIVPFHHLPNPTDDMDQLIASDNPYACLDGNYFIPDWPVGRLPGESGPDAGLLLEQIRRLVRFHAKNAPVVAGKRKSLGFWKRAHLWLRSRAAKPRNGSFGYTAAVWRRSSLAVYRPIGEANSLVSSPPELSGSLPGKKSVSVAYYNLHGMVDAAEWYGQRDSTESQTGPDYPIALSPKDLSGKGQVADIIFSEACYGAHIDGKTEDKAMALKFLARGSLVLVGSTCAAYGSVTTPLIGADLLGHYFWKGIKAGETAGEALMQARIDLVREMTRRQGFLDAEDQKTLISFVMYGDPLVGSGQQTAQYKNLLRVRAHPVIKTVSDQKEDATPVQPVPETILHQVKQIVSEYLPGLESAEMKVCKQVASNSKKPQAGETAKSIKAAPDGNGRVVVTILKDIPIGAKIHHQYARVTLDPRGRMLKLAMSR